MKVIAVKNQILDLSESLLNEDGPTVSGLCQVSGGAVFDSDERLMPLVSGYLSEQAEVGRLSLNSVKTYGRNLGYALEYLLGREEFATTLRDDCFLEARRSVLARYIKQLNEEGLDSSTIRNRDAALMSFISGYLCTDSDFHKAMRKDDPYEKGFISGNPKTSLIIACSLDDLRKLIVSTSSERERCVLQFMHDVGVRRSELPRVTVASIRDAIEYHDKQYVTKSQDSLVKTEYFPILIKGSKGLGGSVKPRYSYISSATAMRVQRYHSSPLFKKHARKFAGPENTPAFLNAHGDAYTSNSVSKLLERVSKKAIVNGLLAKPISPHKLRHGNAYSFLTSPDMGETFIERLVMAQKSLGHSQFTTTEIYTRLPMDLFSSVKGFDEETRTKAGEMEELTKQTRLKIDLGAVK